MTDTDSSKKKDDNSYRLDDCPCFGVEKMLINCPRYFKLQQTDCDWKVSVLCTEDVAGELPQPRAMKCIALLMAVVDLIRVCVPACTIFVTTMALVG